MRLVDIHDDGGYVITINPEHVSAAIGREWGNPGCVVIMSNGVNYMATETRKQVADLLRKD